MPKLNIKQPGLSPVKVQVELSFDKVSFGRHGDNDVVLENPSLSSKHCYLERVKGGFKLIDDDSTNGIKLDDRRFDVININEDMQIMLGDVVFQIAYSDKEFKTIQEEGEIEEKQTPKLPPLN